MDSFQKTFEELALRADIQINGKRPWDIQVHHPDLYRRLLLEGSLGLGESYMNGWWDSEQLDELICRILKLDLYTKIKPQWIDLLNLSLAKIFNRQSFRKASDVIENHYNLGNNLYQKMLDERMLYTCAYWEGAQTLEEAQERKLELVCKKIGLERGMTVLDLGCGWGGFAQYAAEKYGAQVVAVNKSSEQLELARERSRGLPVEFRQQDYREAQGLYDRVVSIGIMEHVGPKNYRTYMEVAHRCLKPEGLAFIHTIGSNRSYIYGDYWLDRYIFPNGVTPSVSQLAEAMEGIFIIEDIQNIGPHYDPTLLEWNRRFQQAWLELKQTYPERFKRMWEYYLLSCAGIFRARVLQLWQIVMNRPGRPQPRCRFS